MEELGMLGANLESLALVFGDSQMSGSLYEVAKGATLILHSLQPIRACAATCSLLNLLRRSQDTLQRFSLGRGF